MLTRYQIEAGMAEPEPPLRELAEVGRTRFSLPYQHPVQAFTYTIVQEKATQLFYQRFTDVVTEPVLRDLLRRLARRRGTPLRVLLQPRRRAREPARPNATVADLKDVLATFRGETHAVDLAAFVAAIRAV